MDIPNTHPTIEKEEFPEEISRISKEIIETLTRHQPIEDLDLIPLAHLTCLILITSRQELIEAKNTPNPEVYAEYGSPAIYTPSETPDYYNIYLHGTIRADQMQRVLFHEMLEIYLRAEYHLSLEEAHAIAHEQEEKLFGPRPENILIF